MGRAPRGRPLEWEGLGLREAGQSLASFKSAVSYPFLFFVPRPHQIAAACSAREAEEQAIRLERRTLTAEVGAAWYGLLAGQRRVRVAAGLSADALEAQGLAKKAREAGVRSAYDVERADAEALEAQGDEADARASLRLDQLAFAFALGSDRPAFPRALEPSAPAEPGPAEGAAPETVPDDLAARALTADPAWAKARASVSAAEARLHVEQVAAVPFSGVTGSAGRKSEPGAGQGGTAGLEVPLPLFDRNRGGIAKAEAELLAARAEEEAARRAVVSDLAQDWERVRAAAARLARYARPLTEMRRRGEASARRLYGAGQSDQAEWLQARRDLKAAEKAEVDAWKDAAVARFALETALGAHDAPPR